MFSRLYPPRASSCRWSKLCKSVIFPDTNPNLAGSCSSLMCVSRPDFTGFDVCGLQPTSLNHLEALLHLFSSFLRQITKGSNVYALFPVAALLPGLGTEAEFTCHSVSDISSWCQRKRREREESAERERERERGNERQDDGKTASDRYKMYDSHQNIIGLVYVCIWMTYKMLANA